MMLKSTPLTVALAHTDSHQWAWRVLHADGREAVVGESLREDVARAEAEFFKRYLEKRSNSW